MLNCFATFCRVNCIAMMSAFSICWLFASPSFAASPLVVATNQVPPFVVADSADGKLNGLTIALVERIGSMLGRPVEWRLMPFAEVLDAVTKGGVDIAAAAISVTAERERNMDFSHPYIFTGLGIAVPDKPVGGLRSIVEALTSRAFLESVSALFLLLAAIGICMWLFEKRVNREHFGGGVLRGIGNGFWWSAVTMATVGYGDKVPHSFLGRILGVFWMFASVILISSFTASISAGLTVSHLEGAVSGPQDLPKVRVITVQNTSSARYLDGQHVHFATRPNLAEAIEALAQGEADALVYDAPLLSYQIAQRPTQDLKVLDVLFAKQNYAIAMPAGSTLRKPVNESLLATLSSPDWQDVVRKWIPEH